jgi:hypothetical protein
MLNVVYLVVEWSPVLREGGCCEMVVFIFTLLGCILFTGRKCALQRGKSMVELSWVTMADLLVLLCIGGIFNCRIVAGKKLFAENISRTGVCV